MPDVVSTRGTREGCAANGVIHERGGVHKTRPAAPRRSARRGTVRPLETEHVIAARTSTGHETASGCRGWREWWALATSHSRWVNSWNTQRAAGTVRAICPMSADGPTVGLGGGTGRDDLSVRTAITESGARAAIARTTQDGSAESAMPRRPAGGGADQRWRPGPSRRRVTLAPCPHESPFQARWGTFFAARTSTRIGPTPMGTVKSTPTAKT